MLTIITEIIITDWKKTSQILHMY